MTSAHRARRPGRTGRHQPIAGLVGVVFLIVGVLGFIPGVTSDFDELAFAGHESGAMLLGLFQVSVLHNMVHLLFGLAGLALARSESTARAFLIGGGIVYLLLWLYGMVIDDDGAANFVPLNDADDWLHLALGLGMLGLGLFPDDSDAGDKRRAAADKSDKRAPLHSSTHPEGREMPQERVHGRDRDGIGRKDRHDPARGNDLPG